MPALGELSGSAASEEERAAVSASSFSRPSVCHCSRESISPVSGCMKTFDLALAVSAGRETAAGRLDWSSGTSEGAPPAKVPVGQTQIESAAISRRVFIMVAM